MANASDSEKGNKLFGNNSPAPGIQNHWYYQTIWVSSTECTSYITVQRGDLISSVQFILQTAIFTICQAEAEAGDNQLSANL